MIDNEKYVKDLIGKELLVGTKNNVKLAFLREVLSFNKENNRLVKESSIQWEARRYNE